MPVRSVVFPVRVAPKACNPLCRSSSLIVTSFSVFVFLPSTTEASLGLLLEEERAMQHSLLCCYCEQWYENNHPIHVYKPKGQYLLSAGEKRFFDALLNSVPPSLYICPKVRIADLVETHLLPSDPNYWKTLAPINQKHVDFVLVNKSDFAPRVIIEL